MLAGIDFDGRPALVEGSIFMSIGGVRAWEW